MRKQHAHKKPSNPDTFTHIHSKDTHSVTLRPLRIYPPSQELLHIWQHYDSYAGTFTSLMTIREPTPIIGFISNVLPKNKLDAYRRRERVFRLVNQLIGALAFVLCENEQNVISAAAAVDLFYDTQRKCIFLVGSILLPEMLERNPLEDLKMHLFMYTSCNVLFHVQETQRFDIAMLRQFEALAEAKKYLMTALQQVATKKNRREKSANKHAKSSHNACAPGYCVPFSVFVLPGNANQMHASASFASAFCRKMDSLLFHASRALCPGVVTVLRSREILSVPKESGLFYLEPSHSVALVSNELTTWKGDLEERCERVLTTLEDEAEDAVSIESLVQLLDENTSGIAHLTLMLDRFVSTMHGNKESHRRFHAKEKDNYCELLSPGSWLAMYQNLYDALDQITEKKKTLFTSFSREQETS